MWLKCGVVGNSWQLATCAYHYKSWKRMGKKAISRWEVSRIKTKIKTEFNMAWAFLKMLN